MKIANIAMTKNHLSQLIEVVKAGESVLIVDRKKPVARLEPYTAKESCEWELDLMEMERCGLVTLPTYTFDVKAFLKKSRPRLKRGGSLQDEILKERASGL